MAAPSRATLLFPRERAERREEEDCYAEGIGEEERESVRSLDSVGAVAVLGAMVEQRKRSSSLPPPPPDESGERPRVDKKSLGFLKIR
jgi:hypothetical protein